MGLTLGCIAPFADGQIEITEMDTYVNTNVIESKRCPPIFQKWELDQRPLNPPKFTLVMFRQQVLKHLATTVWQWFFNNGSKVKGIDIG